MDKRKTIEEDLEEAAYRAQEHLFEPELRNGVDPDWDGQEEFKWESIGNLSNKILDDVGHK